MPVSCEPLPWKNAPVTLPVVLIAPEEVTLVNVPTLVMLGCALVVTVPAVVALVAVVADPALVAKVALATLPVTFAPGMLVSPAPEPINCPLTMALPPAKLPV